MLLSRLSITGIPATGLRACSSNTNEFHAAVNNRGNAVTHTVSSTSQIMALVVFSLTITTSWLRDSAPATCTVTVAQLGVVAASMSVSTTRLRSARFWWY